jgi:cell division protein FtsB
METLGNLVDKLTVVNLKIWHLEEIAHDQNASDSEVATAKRKIDVLNLQRHALIEEFDTLLQEVLSGKKKVPVFYEVKDYKKGK